MAFGALIIAANLVMRRFARYADPLILPCAVLLSGFGLVLLNRLDESYAIAYSASFQRFPRRRPRCSGSSSRCRSRSP